MQNLHARSSENSGGRPLAPPRIKTFDIQVSVASNGAMRMRLSVAGAGLTTECDWELCTALRDNIQHYFEGGSLSGLFPAVHALADRCWAPATVRISAAQLRAELTQAWQVLATMNVERMAIGIRSR